MNAPYREMDEKRKIASLEVEISQLKKEIESNLDTIKTISDRETKLQERVSDVQKKKDGVLLEDSKPCTYLGFIHGPVSTSVFTGFCVGSSIYAVYIVIRLLADADV